MAKLRTNSLEKEWSAQQKAQKCIGLARPELLELLGKQRPPPEFRWGVGDQQWWYRCAVDPGVQWDPGVNGSRRPAGHAGLAEDMADLCG